MPKPSPEPSRGPSPEPSSGRRGNAGNPAKLQPGVKPGQRRGPDGKLLPKSAEQPMPARPVEPTGPPLSEETSDTLSAMRHVYTTGPQADRTHQQKSLRRFLETSPVAFHDRLAKLEEAEAERTSPNVEPNGAASKWDGVGTCPACDREAPLRDPGSDRILALLDELDEAAAGEEADENSRHAGEPGAKATGRAKQEALRAALAAEQEARTAVAKERQRQDIRPKNEIEKLFDDVQLDGRTSDLELLGRLDPENAIASIDQAIRSTQEREGMWRAELVKLVEVAPVGPPG